MGIEIRKVPTNYKHPQNPCSHWPKCSYPGLEHGYHYQPKYDKNYFEAMNAYNIGIVLWNKDEHPIQLEHKKRIEAGNLYKLDKGDQADIDTTKRLNDPDYYSTKKGYNYWDYFGNPPDEKYYHKYLEHEKTWFQLYETVSEGTPVSPPFATKEELADYLAEHGDYWDQKRRRDGDSFISCQPWGKETAYKFVFGDGWAPSLVSNNGKLMSGVEFVTQEKP